jgi:hypothetical protein
MTIGYICGFTVIPAIVLREKGVDFDFIYLDIFGKRESKRTPSISLGILGPRFLLS